MGLGQLYFYEEEVTSEILFDSIVGIEVDEDQLSATSASRILKDSMHQAAAEKRSSNHGNTDAFLLYSDLSTDRFHFRKKFWFKYLSRLF